MSQILPLNDTVRAALEALRAACSASKEAYRVNAEVYERDKDSMNAASRAWRARNPGVYVGHEDKDPEVMGAKAEYDRTLKLAHAAADAAGIAGRTLAAAVHAQIHASIPALPVLTYKPIKKGFRYLLDGVKDRESVRAKPYTAVLVSLVVKMTVDGISAIEWASCGEYSATPKRLVAEAMKSTGCTYIGWQKELDAEVVVRCTKTVVTAKEEAVS
jgi:hypothetical protein